MRRPGYPIVVALVTFIVLVVAAGVRSVPTMYVQPFEREFGWSDGMISNALALQIALYGLTGPFAAAAMERYGIRNTVFAALGLVAAAMLAVTQVHAAWQLLPWAGAAGIGVGCMALSLGATIANRWFVEQRGVVIGIFSAGNAAGQLVFLPLFGALIEQHGWRITAVVLALVALAMIPLWYAFLRERPIDVQIPPWGGSELEPAPEIKRNPLHDALAALSGASKTRVFWLLGSTFFICGLSTNGLIGTHLVPACGDHGIPETRAAGLLAAMGIFDLAGTTFSGWLSDRYDSRWLLFWYYGLRGLSLIFLPYAFGFAALGLPVFAVFYGLDWIATVPPTLRLTTAAFGREKAAVVFGWIVALHQVGASVAALGAGWMRTILGTYDQAFIASGCFCLLASALVLAIARHPKLEPAFA
jgi:MFS family permease